MLFWMYGSFYSRAKTISIPLHLIRGPMGALLLLCRVWWWEDNIGSQWVNFQAEWLRRSKRQMDLITSLVWSWSRANRSCIGAVCFAIRVKVIFTCPEDSWFPRSTGKNLWSASILHVNEAEKHWLSGCRESSQPSNVCIETGQWSLSPWGKRGGCLWWPLVWADGFPAEVVDTVGVRDSHVGLFLSARLRRLRYHWSLKLCQ